MLMALPQGGLNEEQQATARALALATLDALPRRRQSAGATAVGRRACADHGVRRRRHRHVRVRAVARGGARAARAKIDAARLAQGRHRARHRVPRRHHRRGHVGPARGPPSAAPPAWISSSSRRTTRSAEPGTRTAIRVVASTIRTTTTATPSRSATTGRSTSRRKTCCSTTSSAARTTSTCATTSGSAPRCCRQPGPRRSSTGRSACVLADGAEESIEANAVISAVGQLNRPSFPADQGSRLVRRPVVPLGAVGPLASTCAASGSR